MEGSCRLCFSEDANLISVLEFKSGLEISDLVEVICCVRIEHQGLYSKEICSTCLDTIVSAYELRVLSIQNERCLKEKFLCNEVVVKIETKLEAIPIKSESLDDIDREASSYGFSAIEFSAQPAIVEQSPVISSKRQVTGKQLKERKTKDFECDICPVTQSSKELIKRHINKRHASLNICLICSKKLCSPTILRQHMQRQHSDEVSLKCELCDEILKSRKKLELHLDVHKFFIEDESKALTCRLCHTNFKDETEKMFRHINYHKRRGVKQTESKKTRDDSSLVCPLCGKLYRTKQILHQHIKRHGDSGDKYKCPKCPKNFKTWGELFYHNAVHTTERNFICEICSKGFKSKRDLRNHRIRHETKDVKTFQCPHCLIFLKRRYSLNRHILIHTGEKPFSCAYCERSFTQKNELNKHLRIHVGECTYRCEESGCTEAFRLLAELRLHQEDHYAKKN